MATRRQAKGFTCHRDIRKISYWLVLQTLLHIQHNTYRVHHDDVSALGLPAISFGHWSMPDAFGHVAYNRVDNGPSERRASFGCNVSAVLPAVYMKPCITDAKHRAEQTMQWCIACI